VEKKVPIKNKVSDEHKQTSEVDLDDASSFNWTLEKEEDSIVAASSDSKEAIDTLLASLNTKAFTGFDLDIHTPNLNAEAARSIHGSDDEAGKLKKRKKSPFYIGLIASCNQSTINNIEYRVSRISTSLIESSPAYSFSYGLMAVYAFSVKDALVSELYINNQYKQSIAGYDEGYYYQKKTQLDYSSVSLLYERRFPFMFFDKQLNLAVKTGGYFSYLKQVNEIIDEETLPVEHEFENSDYGLRFMLGQQTKVKNFVLDFGVNASYGLNNIFKGNALKPTEFDRTNTYYLGIYLSIRYRL